MPVDWSATLRSANDKGSVLEDLAAHFATCQYTTSLGAGFDQMTTTLCMPGKGRLDPRLPLDVAGRIFREWRGMIARVFIGASLGWQGRCADIYPHDQDANGEYCQLDVLWQGHSYDLERDPPVLDPSYADANATASATTVARDVILNHNGIIAKRFAHLAETTVNIGAVQISMLDSARSLILQQLKGASVNGREYAFLIWDPAEGPYLVPIGEGPTKYKLFLSGSPGTGVRWKLSEYVSDTRALFTNGSGNSDATEWVSSDLGPALNGGLRAYRAISLDNVNLDGATAGRDVFANLHQDPIGIVGSFPIQDTITNDQDGLEYAGLVRAGDIAVVPDVLPFDSQLDRSGRTWTIETTTHDPFSGRGSVTLDSRSIRSRAHERMTQIRNTQRVLEPGMAHNLNIPIFYEYNPRLDVSISDPIRITDEPYEFTLVRTSSVSVEILALIANPVTDTTNFSWRIGYAADGDSWDEADEQMMSQDRWVGGGTGQPRTARGLPTPRIFPAGKHTLHLYVKRNSAVGTYELANYRLYIRN